MACIGPRQRLDFDRIAHRRCGAVRFDIGNLARIDAGTRQRCTDDCRLAVHAGRREAGLGAAVVVHRDAVQHRVHRVAIGHRVGQAFEQHHGRAVAEHRALGAGIEAARVPIWRQHRAFLVEVAAAWRAGDRCTSGQRHVALAGAQGVESLRHRDQRGRARGMDADGRAAQVQAVGHARGDVVLLVGQHHLKFTDGLDQVGSRRHMALQIRGVVHAAVDADRHGALVGHVAGPLQAFPADFQEDALLRVHQVGFFRVDAEECGVEVLDAVDHATGAHIGGVGTQRSTDAGVEFGLGEKADRVAAGNEVVPELLDVGGAGKAAGHGDQRDGFGPGVVRAGGRRAGGDGCGRCSRFNQFNRYGLRSAARASVVGLPGFQLQRDGARRRLAEKQGGRQPPHTALLQLRQHIEHAQRVAAEFEKVVVTADPIELQYLRERCTDLALALGARLVESVGQIRPLVLRIGQGGTVQLAVGGAR